jgi:sarcosine oxidase subunit alpha
VSQPRRLKSGGRVDHFAPRSFSFDGRQLTGLAGDTLASALLANDVHLVGRSFKYHRPRGIFGAGVEEPNALVTIDRGKGRYDSNSRATVIELFEGLVADSQNRWPSLRFDIGSLADRLAPLLPAGFYYKTFLWPRRGWHALYEPAIRATAGLGRAPSLPDPDHYAFSYAHCDVLIVGAGPAGLAAALAAADSNARVILCDEGAEFGGWLLSNPQAVIEGIPAWAWIEQTLAELVGRPNVRMLPRTTAFGYGGHNMIGLAERLTDHLAHAAGARERHWQVRARQVILATGSIERPIVFPDNDRPGIMLSSAVRTYVDRFAVLPGSRIVVCTSHDSAYHDALAVRAAGAEVTIVDARTAITPHLRERAKRAGVTVLPGTIPTGSRGRLRVTSLKVSEIDEGLRGAKQRELACDLVMMAGGWTPTVHLFSQSRGRLRWDEGIQAFVPDVSVQAERSAGACRGRFDLGQCLEDGYEAGLAAAGDAGFNGKATPRFEKTSQPADAGVPQLFTRGRGRAFLDYQNDVSVKDVRLAVREGFRSIEHIKRYTTSGMATDQGRTSGLNTLAAASEALQRPVPSVGLTTFRAPYTPVTFGALAGYNRKALFAPARMTPIHEWATEHNAVFEDVGIWKRARYFPRAGEGMQEAVTRECLATRSAAGIFDASTLGKIEVVGPDAAEFMNRMYTNSWSKLGVGRCRYGVMLREDGFVFDDGVVGRIAEDRFHVTTTTGGAPHVLNHMEDYLQTEFPELRVWLTSTTEQWAVIALNGPLARNILAPLVEDIDLDPVAFPHMSVREGRICGVPTRLFRVSFTGELGFEVNVPAGSGRRVWQAIYEQGKHCGLVPYGTETMHVLRAEKGYIIIGQETDGTVTPYDLGLDWAVGRTKPDFVGKRSLARSGMSDPMRKQLVGLLTDDGGELHEGAQIIEQGADAAGLAVGHVTSAYQSAVVGRPVALALLAGGHARKGSSVHVQSGKRLVEARIVDPVFYDPAGERLNV